MVAAHHDEDVAAVDLACAMSGTPTPSSEQVALAAQVVHGVGGERLELHRQAGAGLRHRRARRSRRSAATPSATSVVAGVDGAVDDAQPVALGDRHDVGAEVVDQRDARLDEDLRAEVRVAAGRRAGGVEHGGGLAGDERLGGDPVEVQVVDDRDVAGSQPLGEVLGPGVDAGRAGDDAGFGQGGALAQGGSHRRSSSHGRELEQLCGVRPRGVGVLLTGEHPGQLAYALVLA